MMKILILGAAGFVGSSIIDRLIINDDLEILAVDDLSFGYKERLKSCLTKIQFYEQSLESFCKKKISNIDVIINCAAIAPLPENQISHHRSLIQNVASCGAITDFSIKNDVSKIIHFSSSAVYERMGDQELIPHTEADPVNPRLMYPVSKMLSENYFQSQYDIYNLDVTCIRLFNLYGPKQDYFRVQPPLLGYLIRSLLTGEVPTLFASKSARRDYVYIDDLVEFIQLLIQKPFEKSFKTPNFGSGQAFSVYELVEKLEKISNRKLNYKIGGTKRFWGHYQDLFTNAKALDEEPLRNEIDKMSLASTKLLTDEYNFKATTTIDTGLARCLEYAETII